MPSPGYANTVTYVDSNGNYRTGVIRHVWHQPDAAICAAFATREET